MSREDMLSPNEMKLAEAYVPIQPYERLYPLAEGWDKGTIFPSLYRPYIEEGGAS